MGGAAPSLDPVTQFRELYLREYASVYRAVRAIVLDPGEAEDVAQDSFVRAYRARFGYRPTAPVGAWMHRIAVNTAISHLRRRKLQRLLPMRLYSSLATLALADLSPKLRAVVALHHGLGYRRDEIASMLGIPSGTVASRLAKAMAIMRHRLDVGAPGDQAGAPERLLDERALP